MRGMGLGQHASADVSALPGPADGDSSNPPFMRILLMIRLICSTGAGHQGPSFVLGSPFPLSAEAAHAQSDAIPYQAAADLLCF